MPSTGFAGAEDAIIILKGAPVSPLIPFGSLKLNVNTLAVSYPLVFIVTAAIESETV